MKKISIPWCLRVLAVSFLFSGCAMMSRDDIAGRELDTTANAVDLRVKESRTLSTLAKIEVSISNYIKEEGQIPPRLQDLVPKYLAEIPNVELSVGHHREANDVRNYPSSILRDGQIDGTQLKDSGKWGYVYNDRQVIIFVDCTHLSSRGIPWFQERGVF